MSLSLNQFKWIALTLSRTLILTLTLTSAANAAFVEESLGDELVEARAVAIDTDSSGEVHAIFATEELCTSVTAFRLYYGRRSTGGTWDVQPVLRDGCALPTPAAYADFLIGVDDVPRMMVRALDEGTVESSLLYGTFDGTAWNFEELDPENDVGQDPSMEMDADGSIHLGYGDAGDGPLTLRYGVYSDGVWTSELVDASNFAGGYNSLSLDPDGQPCLSYLAYEGNWIRFARQESGSWVTEDVASGVDSFGCTDLVVSSSDGTAHIAWARLTNTVAYGYRPAGGSWTLEDIPVTSGLLTAELQLELDENDVPHIVYTERESHVLYYMVQTGSGWVTTELRPDADYHKRFHLDENGVGHILFPSANGDEIFYGTIELVPSDVDPPHRLVLDSIRSVPNPAVGPRVNLLIEASSAGSFNEGWTEAATHLSIHDVAGRRLAVIETERDGSAAWQNRSGSGVYLVRAFTGEVPVAEGRITVLR